MPRPQLHYSDILEWADEYRARTGKFPTKLSGRVTGQPGEKWGNLNSALRVGLRGFPGGSSLARLLAKKRGYRNVGNLPKYTLIQILKWSDDYYARTRNWPTRESGPIPKSRGETWLAVDTALRDGGRGLPGNSSLFRLLAARRGVKLHVRKPPLNVDQILDWADAHQRRTGDWPNVDSGPILGADRETWGSVHFALQQGKRGLPGRSSLAKLLAKGRGVRNVQDLPKFTLNRILAWADAHFERTGTWPKKNSGSIPEAPGENWHVVSIALSHGTRGLPRGGSLQRLLFERRGIRYLRSGPAMSVERILKWADAHKERTGDWPRVRSGIIQESPGDTWLAVDEALRSGGRGLPGGSTLRQLLQTRRGARNKKRLPKLHFNQILAWAVAHYERSGKWPTNVSGPIPESDGETWSGVHNALYRGERGHPGGDSLYQLLVRAGRKR